MVQNINKETSGEIKTFVIDRPDTRETPDKKDVKGKPSDKTGKCIFF
jgi:hypothetical protein